MNGDRLARQDEVDLQLLTQYEGQHLSERQALPDRYLGLSDGEMDLRIVAARAALGDRLVILGHHYQRDEVIKFADETGDSLRLARHAAGRRDAEFIVFCGVHFMAESADVLSAQHQQVILPDLAAGCSMADMAGAEQLEQCWQELEQMGISGVIPVTYINSAVAIKAFCGERGGVVCTSSNTEATLRWAWERGERILFLPDQHLGRNTGYRMGVPLDQMVVWDPDEAGGGLDPRSGHARPGDSLEGSLLRTYALYHAADREHQNGSSDGARHRASRSAPGMSSRPPMTAARPSTSSSRSPTDRRDQSGRWEPRSTWSIASRGHWRPRRRS